MLVKTINITVGVLLTLTVGCAAALFAFMAWRLLVLSGTAAFHLMNS
jgi:hypothetical protein